VSGRRRVGASGAYGALLRSPGVRWQAGTGLLAQVTQGAAGIGIILVIRQHAGSLALAGGVVGALSIAAGIARPIQGRLIDRRGAVGVMAVCGVVHPAALVAIVGLSHRDDPRSLLIALGLLAGLTLPPVSTSMRVAWGEVVGEHERTAAYSLVYLTQELAILTGPLVLAATIAASSSSLALITVAALSGAGTLAFSVSIAPPADRDLPARQTGASLLREPGIRIVLALAVLVGGVIGGLEVGTPTFATAHRAPAATGVLIAAVSVGGIIGAALYGRRRWSVPPSRRLVALLALLALALVVIPLADSLLAVGFLLLVAGVPLNPALTTFSLLVDQHAPGRTVAEAFGWLSTGLATGTGAASAIAGVFAQRQHDAQAAFIVAAVAGAAASVLAVSSRRVLRGRAREGEGKGP
jgi:predicted MFS family arabinose efflux permease